MPKERLFIKEWRRARDLTQVELAVRLKMSQANVARLEAGGDTRVSTLARVAEAFGVSIADLFQPPAEQVKISQLLEQMSEEQRRRALAVLEAIHLAA